MVTLECAGNGAVLLAYAMNGAPLPLQHGYPLRVIGANSIAAYLLAHGSEGFIVRSFRIHLGTDIFELLGPAYEPLLAGITVLVVQWLVLWWLYRQRIFIRI